MQNQIHPSSVSGQQPLKQNHPKQTVAEGLTGTQAILSKPIIMAEQLEQKVKTASSEMTILHQLDLQIMAGEQVAITGRSGSGKSTLLGGVLVLLAVLYVITLLMLKLIQKTSFGQSYIRQPKQISLQILALSLGLGLLTILLFLRNDLMQRWQTIRDPGTHNSAANGSSQQEQAQ